MRRAQQSLRAHVEERYEVRVVIDMASLNS
jgi:hypothetical protein